MPLPGNEPMVGPRCRRIVVSILPVDQTEARDGVVPSPDEEVKLSTAATTYQSHGLAAEVRNKHDAIIVFIGWFVRYPNLSVGRRVRTQAIRLQMTNPRGLRLWQDPQA